MLPEFGKQTEQCFKSVRSRCHAMFSHSGMVAHGSQSSNVGWSPSAWPSGSNLKVKRSVVDRDSLCGVHRRRPYSDWYDDPNLRRYVATGLPREHGPEPWQRQLRLAVSGG